MPARIGSPWRKPWSTRSIIPTPASSAAISACVAEIQTLRADLIGTIWRVVLTVFGIQVVLVGVLVAILMEFMARGAA